MCSSDLVMRASIRQRMFIREGRITTIVQTYIVKGPLRLLDKRRLFRSKQLYSLFLVLP